MFEDVLVLVPVYNEREKIGEVILGLKAEGFKNILVVDDGSSDGSFNLVVASKVKVLKHCVNLGYGAALRTGFEYFKETSFKYLITCDADGQHLGIDVLDVARGLKESNVDIVLGNRFLLQEYKGENIPFLRNIYIKLASFINFVYAGFWISDSQCGLRGYSKEVLKRLDLKSRSMEISLEILREIRKNKIKFKEIPVEAIYTEYSMSKGQGFLKGLNTLYHLIVKEF